MAKSAISNITCYHLKWPGTVENSAGKRKIVVHIFLPDANPYIHKYVRVLLSVLSVLMAGKFL